jgi:glutamate carboxypeptidase
MRKTLAILLALSFAPTTAGAALSEVERQIVEHVEAHQREPLALLERVVEINSGTLNFAGVRRVGEAFAAELERLGFETRWVEGAEFERAGHLVAERLPVPEREGSAPHVLLIGHLDTVFEVDSPFQGFERLSESAARGPGVSDMKGGDVVLIYALRALEAVGALGDLQVTVVLTGDEEKSGRPLLAARRALVEAARGVDVAIGFEDGDGNPETAVIARRGSVSWSLEATGVPAHSSQVFQPAVGAGAIYETARILTGFHTELAGEPDLTFNPGVIVGGTEASLDTTQGRGSAFGKNNVVAQSARATGDVRALSPQQYQRAVETMQRVVEHHLPRTDAKLTFGEGYPPLAATDGNRRLLALYDEVSRDLGTGSVTAVDPRNAGAADVSFVADQVPMVLDGVGLMGSGGHTIQETADLATLPTQTARAAVLLYRLGRSLRQEP